MHNKQFGNPSPSAQRDMAGMQNMPAHLADRFMFHYQVRPGNLGFAPGNTQRGAFVSEVAGKHG